MQSSTSPLAWAVHGIAEHHVRRALEPVLGRLPGLRRVRIEDRPGGVEGDGRPDWDLLLIGYESPGPGTLEAQVRRICRARPLGCVVALVPSLTPAREIELLRAGAVAALDPDASPELVEQAIDHAVAAAEARRAGCERHGLGLINQLAVTVNHEINNPLTGLMGTAELMLMQSPDLDERTRRDLRTILDQGRRIQEVTARLKSINQVRSIPYGSHDLMLDLAGAAPAAPASREQTVADHFLPMPSILVIDDNPLIIDLIGRLFENRFRIHAAGCASDALERVGERCYDVALIDLVLPEMDGLELYRAIRRLRPRQKAILTTGFQDDPRIEQAIHEGALGCVYKPFQLEQLEEALGEALSDRTPHRDRPA